MMMMDETTHTFSLLSPAFSLSKIFWRKEIRNDPEENDGTTICTDPSHNRLSLIIDCKVLGKTQSIVGNNRLHIRGKLQSIATENRLSNSD